MVSEDSLRAKIQKRRASIGQIDAEMATLSASRERLIYEIGAFEELLSEAGEPPVQRSTMAPDVVSVVGTVHGASAVNGEGRSTRGLSTSWKAVLKRLAREDTFTYDDVVVAAAKCSVEIEKSAARSRMFSYVEAGYVERMNEGVLRLTQKGRDAAE